MQTGNKKIYWDSCVFISWMKEGKEHGRTDTHREGMRRISAAVDGNTVVLVTSSFSLVEIRKVDITPEKWEQYLQLFDRENVELIDLTRDVAELALQVAVKIGLKNADAVQIASALVYGVDEFQTFDGSGDDPKPTDILQKKSEIKTEYGLEVATPSFDLGLFAASPAS